MSKLFVSASELETWYLCPRQWAGVYIHGLRKPPMKSTAIGGAVHKVLEKYAKTGEMPDMTDDVGAIASEFVPFIQRSPVLRLEEGFTFDADGTWFVGYKDGRIPGELREGIPWVRDYKTTKDWRWVKTLEEILYHPQAIVYATDEFRRGPWEYVDLDWLYGKTTRPYGTPRQMAQRVGRQQIADLFFGHVLPDAQHIDMLRHVEDLHMLDLPPNYSSCDAFGGCHLLHICRPQPQDRLRGIMSQGSLLAKIRGGATPSPAFTPPGMPQTAPQAPPPAAAPAPWQQPVTPAAPEAPPAAPPWAGPPGATPPGYAAPGAPPNGAPPAGPPPGWDAAFQQQPAAPPQAAAPAPWTPPARVDAPPAQPKEPKERKRKQAEVIGDDQPSQHGQNMPSVEYVTPTTTEANGFTLYIGCMPLGSTPIMGLDYCDAAHEYMRDQNGGTHYALVEYGKGKAMLQIALADLIKVNELKGDVVLMRSEIEELCAPVFRNLAQKVVVAL